MVYSGDIGAVNQQMLNDPTLISETDYLIMETTYGDRAHETQRESGKRFLDIIFKTVARGGTVVVPAFALGVVRQIKSTTIRHFILTRIAEKRSNKAYYKHLIRQIK